MNKSLKDFLRELSTLTNKYNIEIAACRCCNSPFLLKVGDNIEAFDILKDSLQFNRASKKYSVEDTDKESYYQYKDEMYNSNGIKLHADEDDE